MKLKIKVKVLTEGCMPSVMDNGDWIDLRSAVNMTIPAPQSGVLKRKLVGAEKVKGTTLLSEVVSEYSSKFSTCSITLENTSGLYFGG